jgi:hypothetical protein
MHRPAKLNIGRFQKLDVVRHYRTRVIYVVLNKRWRSETLALFNVETREIEVHHPNCLDLEDTAMVVLAAIHAL